MLSKFKKYLHTHIYTLLFSFFAAFTGLSCYMLTYHEGIRTLPGLFIILLLSLLCSPILDLLFSKIADLSVTVCPSPSVLKGKGFPQFLFCFFIIFLCWLPIFLAFYPGIGYYDIEAQLTQYQTGVFCNNHPLVHTVILGFFINLFPDINTGFALYSLLQLLLLDSAISYALLYLYKRGYSRKIRLPLLAFFALLPVHSLLAVSATKDVIFSALVLFFFVQCLNLKNLETVRITDFLKLIPCSVLLMLFRSNASYAFAAAAAFFLLLCLIKKWAAKKLLLYTLLTLFIFTLCNKALIHVLDADPGSIKEMMSVPSQQLIRIYPVCEDEAIKEKILSYLPEPENYITWVADAAKKQLPFEILDSKCKRFLLLSGICAVKYPVVTLDSFLYTNQGFFDIVHNPYEEDHFFLAPTEYRGGITLQSRLPELHDFLVENMRTKENLHNPILVILFSSAFYIWCFLFSLVVIIKRRRKKLLIVCLFPLAYLLTALLGPGAIIRYSYLFFLIAPILLCEAFQKNQ